MLRKDKQQLEQQQQQAEEQQQQQRRHVKFISKKCRAKVQKLH